MVSQIIADFHSDSAFGKCNEVDLFRKLANSIVKHSPSTFVDETHGGNFCNVNFTSVTGLSETCEIADLLIISMGDNGNLRATFWQAKKQTKSKWLSATSETKQLDFAGQFNQWDLLSRRPTISGVNQFQPPQDLLTSFHSPSIGTFGVFYKQNSVIEVGHSIAEFIGCNNPTAKQPKMSINGYLEEYYYGNSNEVISRLTLNGFLSALFDQKIGALLDPAETAHKWLVQYVREKVSAVRKGRTDLSSLDRFIHDRPPVESAMGDSGDGLSILFVRTGVVE